MRKNQLSRRCFLVAAHLPVVSAFSRVCFPDSFAPASSINVGLITEPTASHRTGYLSALARCDGVGRVFVADHTGDTLRASQDRLGPRFGGAFRDSRQMLAAASPDLTVITLEAHRTPPAIETALRAGSHVLTEKPGCVTLQDFQRVARLAQQRDQNLMLAMATRSGGAFQKARQLIADGEIGKPYAATMDWIADQTRLTDPKYQASWLSFKQRAGGGKLIFHGCHYLDLIQFLVADSIRDVNCFCQNVGGEPIEVEDAAVVSFRLTNGMIGTLNTGYYLDRGKQRRIRIWGSQGWLELDVDPKKSLEIYRTNSDAPSGRQVFDYSTEPGLYDLFFQDAINAVITRSNWPITTAESLQVMKVVFAGYRAAETGTTQTIE